MNAKLKKETRITATNEDGTTWTLDHNTTFTDTPACGFPIYDEHNKKLFFPINHDLSGCGFIEDLFDTTQKPITMTTQELKEIAIRMVKKGYTDRDTIRYSDDLYNATKEEINECLDYVDEIIDLGLSNFK